jgi:hypothetical protein
MIEKIQEKQILLSCISQSVQSVLAKRGHPKEIEDGFKNKNKNEGVDIFLNLPFV